MKMQKEKTNKDQNHRGRGVWRAFLIICLIILVFLIVRRVTKPAEEIETVPLPTVSVTKATQGDIKVTTELIGNMQASDIYYVTPKVAGEIKEIYVEQGQQCERHLHLKCVRCGRIIHLDCTFMDEISNHILNDHGFVLQCRNSILYGTCRACAGKDGNAAQE